MVLMITQNIPISFKGGMTRDTNIKSHPQSPALTIFGFGLPSQNNFLFEFVRLNKNTQTLNKCVNPYLK